MPDVSFAGNRQFSRSTLPESDYTRCGIGRRGTDGRGTGGRGTGGCGTGRRGRDSGFSCNGRYGLVAVCYLE